jgi:hypothetical protein
MHNPLCLLPAVLRIRRIGSEISLRFDITEGKNAFELKYCRAFAGQAIRRIPLSHTVQF